jgi:hypothetical protein
MMTAHRLARRFSKLRRAVPLLNVGGWYDIFLQGMLNDHVAITKRGKTDVARRGKHVMVGPWVHGVGTRDNVRAEAPNQLDRVDFGAAAAVDTPARSAEVVRLLGDQQHVSERSPYPARGLEQQLSSIRSESEHRRRPGDGDGHGEGCADHPSQTRVSVSHRAAGHSDERGETLLVVSRDKSRANNLARC